MGKTLTLENTLELMECCVCGITYAVPEDWAAARRQDHVSFSCPNGHGQVFRGETDAQRLAKAERQLAEEQARLRSARAALTAEQDQRRAAELSVRAYKGQATRARRKAAHGVCPAPQCGRTFQDLQRHMAGQHPEYVAEHGAVQADD